MPISSQVPIIGYVANGVTKSFAFPFAILSADDLKVKVGADVVTAGFSIAGVGDRDGGSVTFTDAPASLTPIILYREVTLDRTTDYQENGDLLAVVLDDDLDRIWMALQDQLLLSDRALRSPLGETMNSIPKASERALTVLGFDALGQPVAVTRTEDGGAALALDLLNPESGKGASLVGVSLTDGAPSTVKAALQAHDTKLQNLDAALNFSTLPVASSPVADTDLMVLRQGGANKQLQVSVVRAEFATNAVAAAAAATVAKDGAVVAKTAAEAARDATVVGAAPTVYATTAAGLAATTTGKYFSVPSADSAEYLILYLNNAGVAVEQKRYPSASATQIASGRSWRNEQRIDGAWWAKAKRVPVALYDLSYGEGVGYTLTGGNVATIPELSGNGTSLTPRGTAGTLATFASAGAVQLGAAGVQGYIGMNPGTKKVANKAVLDSFSMHVAAKADAADMNGFLLSLVPDAANSPPGVWISRNNLRVPGMAAVKEGNVSIFDSGGRGSGIDAASAAGPFLYSEFVGDYSASNATYDNVAIVNGFMLPIPQDKTGAGGRLSAGGWAAPLNLGRVILGSHTATTTSPAGAFAAAAVYSDKTHTLAEASSIHRGMLEKWAPELIEDVFAVTTHGQSNAESTIVGNNPNPVSLPNGTAYAWTGTTTVLKDSNIGHVALYGAASAEIGLYFAKEVQRILGWKPIVSNRSSGGVGLIAGGLNGASGYFEPTTEAAMISGAGAGGFDGTWLPWQKLYRKILDYTPRFNVKMRVLIWAGCETDVANLLAIPGGPTAADLEAQSTNIARALENLWNRWKSDIGYTHIALVATGRRGATLAEVQANAAAVAAVNEGYRRFANSRPEAVIIYDHHTKWSSSSFATDDLVVDANGAWVSGAAIYDGVHYSAAQYKAIGVTGARNFLRHLGMYMYGS